MMNAICSKCKLSFAEGESILNSGGEVWHYNCFVCAQCLRPFGKEATFYEFENRYYCEHDFHVLYAPCCNKCNEFIVGRVIKALNNKWHPACFTCNICSKQLAEQGFIKNGNRALCHDCNARVKCEAASNMVCQKCHLVIKENEPLKFRGKFYHSYHFNCRSCGIELTKYGREIRDELYCLKCHDSMGVPICSACHKPIEERVVTALGKQWHVEHFVCSKCEKPFLGNRHFEKKGLAYCETHYHQLFGNLCFMCNQIIPGDALTAFNKAWCVNHFSCFFCNSKLQSKTKFYDVDLKLCCKKCFEKFPSEFRKRLKQFYTQKTKT